MSLPTRGAWIEMPYDGPCAGHGPGRSPHGERGLKWIAQNLRLGDRVSLPTRGAWIEIGTQYINTGVNPVAPHTGSVD